MSAESELVRFLDEVRKKTASGPGRAALQEWVRGYYGKILQFTAGGRSLHAVFTPRGMRLQEGPYPAPDLALIGDAVEELAKRRFDREAVKEVMKAKRVVIRGNLHEAFAFSKVAQAALGGTK